MEPTRDDLKEFKRILLNGSTPYVESILRSEIGKLEALFPHEETPTPEPQPIHTQPIRKFTPINSYAFSDAKDKAMVIIREIRGLEGSEIEFEPAEHGFTITILRESQNLPNLKLTVSPIKKIIPSECKYSTRRDTLTITLKKKKDSTWMKLKKTPLEKKKTPEEKQADKENPNAALMNMMKKMYDEGDDEMKRTISKAMWEAQHKKEEDKDKEK